jgi:hypothetical protein
VWKVLLAAQKPRVWLVASFLVVLFVSRPAFAEDMPSTSETMPARHAEPTRPLLPFRVDLHGVLTWEAEIGAGLRADILLFNETSGFNGRDEIALSLGCDLSFVTFAGAADRLTIWPTVAVQWSLAVREHFVLYPELGIVAQIQPGQFKGLYPNVGFGGRINVYRSLDVLVRLGWPMAVSVGLTF